MVLRSVKFFVAAVALATAAVPVGALAQSASDPPSYAVPPASATPSETIHGRIVSLDGAGGMQLNDDRGFVDTVQIWEGAVLNPAGVQLRPGMRVKLVGTNAGSVFAAHEVDVQQPPSVATAPDPAYAYPDPAYAYPDPAYAYPDPAYPYPDPAYPYPVYPVYGYPYPVYSGPAFAVGIGFGFGGRFRGPAFRR